VAAVADGVRAHASGSKKSATRLRRARYLRACNLLPDGRAVSGTRRTRRPSTFFRHSIDCSTRHAASGRHGDRVVEVPFEGGHLPALFRAGAERPLEADNPAYWFFDALISPRSCSTSGASRFWVKRGISCLVMDGPGTGEAIRFRGHYLRHDYEVAGSACVDYLKSGLMSIPGRSASSP